MNPEEDCFIDFLILSMWIKITQSDVAYWRMVDNVNVVDAIQYTS